MPAGELNEASFIIIHLTWILLFRLSSVSWYAINIFGQRGINNLLLGENNAADQTKMMQDQMNMAAVSMPQDSSKAFKAEREGLLLVEHQWAYANTN